MELKINDEVFVDIKEQKERKIEQCRKQVYDIEKKIEIEKSKHTISYNQIKKLSEEFLNSDKITKQVLEKLIDRVKNKEYKEIILAFKPSIEGETTSLYIKRILGDLDISITKIASGIPIGADMEYIDAMTLERALMDRKNVE